MPENYKGGAVTNTKVWRPEFDIEHPGPDGTGTAAQKVDLSLAGPARVATPGAQIDTTGVGITQQDSLKRVLP